MLLTTLHHLSDMDILDRSSQKLGKVRDVLMDAETGRCEYLLVSAESSGPFGNLGATGAVTPVPLSLFSIQDRMLTMDATRDIFKGAPSFSPGDVGSFSPDYLDKLNRFWGINGSQRTPMGDTTVRERPSERMGDTTVRERPSERMAGTEPPSRPAPADDRPYDTRHATDRDEEPPVRRSA